MMARISIIGEGMLELSQDGAQAARLSYGGDTLNTAIYLARLGLAPDFVSAMGRDPYSKELLDAWQAEGIEIDHVLLHPSRLPGLYSIRTGAGGERSFFYWRGKSAMRDFFNMDGHASALASAAGSDWLYFSGITLSLFTEAEREALYALAKDIRARGGEVVFDPNYRPEGWTSSEAARRSIDRIGEHVRVALPTLDDEAALYGETDADVALARWRERGTALVVLKCGAGGAVVQAPGETAIRVPAQAVDHPVDTTGAGDSFNAAFLNGLVNGLRPADAAAAGNALAAAVILHRGAIIPREAMPASVSGRRTGPAGGPAPI